MALLPNSPAHLNDLRETVERVRAHHQKLLAKCPPADADPVEIARWEGAFLMVRGLLCEELSPLLESWEAGHPQWRSTEKMLGEKTP